MQAFVQPRLANAPTNRCAKHTQATPANKPAAQAPFGKRLLAALLAALAAPHI